MGYNSKIKVEGFFVLRDVYVDALIDRLENKTYRDYAFDALKVFRNESCLISNNSGLIIPFLDIYCQLPRGLDLNLIDIIEAALAWQRILTKKLQYRFIQCNSIPKKDSNIEGNNSIINELIRLYPDCIINAEFYGGKFGADGFIEFNEPPIFKKTWFPLEVGYCRSDQLLTHLFENQCFARFPYGFNFIVIFEDIGLDPVEIY